MELVGRFILFLEFLEKYYKNSEFSVNKVKFNDLEFFEHHKKRLTRLIDDLKKLFSEEYKSEALTVEISIKKCIEMQSSPIELTANEMVEFYNQYFPNELSLGDSSKFTDLNHMHKDFLKSKNIFMQGIPELFFKFYIKVLRYFTLQHQNFLFLCNSHRFY